MNSSSSRDEHRPGRLVAEDDVVVALQRDEPAPSRCGTRGTALLERVHLVVARCSTSVGTDLREEVRTVGCAGQDGRDGVVGRGRRAGGRRASASAPRSRRGSSSGEHARNTESSRPSRPHHLVVDALQSRSCGVSSWIVPRSRRRNQPRQRVAGAGRRTPPRAGRPATSPSGRSGRARRRPRPPPGRRPVRPASGRRPPSRRAVAALVVPDHGGETAEVPQEVSPDRALPVVLRWLSQQVQTSSGGPEPCTA